MELVDNHKFVKETIEKWKKEKDPMYGTVWLTVVLILANLFMLPWVVSYAGTKICLELGLPVNINYICAFTIVALIMCLYPISMAKKQEEMTENDLILNIYNSNERFKSRIILMLITAFLAFLL